MQDSKDMKYEKLAEKMKYYKEDEQGGKKMCDKLQAIWNKYEAEFKANAKEEAEKLANEKSKLIVKNLLKSTTLSKSEIALSVGLSLKEVEEIAITL